MVMVNLMVTDVLTKVIGKMDGKVEKESKFYKMVIQLPLLGKMVC